MSEMAVKRTASHVAVAIGILAVAACSRVDVMFSFADDVLESRTKTFLDMSDPNDEAHLRRTIDALFTVEVETLAPAYGAFLEEQAAVIETNPNGPSREQVAAAVEGFRNLLLESAEQAAPYVASVLVRHTTPDRIGHLEEALAEWRAERAEDEAGETPEEDRAERIERIAEGIERFIPDLSDMQMDIVTEYVEREMTIREPGRYALYTERRHAALIEFLSKQPDEAAIASYIVPWLARPYRVADPAFEADAERWWSGRATLYWAILREMEPEQKAATVARLRRYAADVIALM